MDRDPLAKDVQTSQTGVSSSRGLTSEYACGNRSPSEPLPMKKGSPMIRRLNLMVLLVALTLLPGAAYAQRGQARGQVYGPDGLMYNMNSPEWRASGGNMEVYQQIMEEKMMQQQMLQMQKQQMAYEKQMQDYFKKNPEAKK